MRASPSTEHNNLALDVIRGLAALCVLIAHTRRSVFQMDFVGQFPHTVVGTLLILPTTVAREAVAVFFVLSGYLVGGQVIRGFAHGRFRWSNYMSSRMSRLWTVLIPALALTAVLNVYSHAHYPEQFAQVPGGDAPLTFGSAACNAVFLMHARCDSFGSNGPLWTLAFEFWFYVLFAAFMALWYALRNRNHGVAILMAAIIIVGTVLFGTQVYWYVPAWLMGAGIAWVQPWLTQSANPIGRFVRGRDVLPVSLALGILALGLLTSNIIEQGYPITLALVGVATVPLVTVVVLRPDLFRGRRTALLATLGTISYSLYAFHTPIIELVIAAGSDLWSSDLARVAAVYVVSAIGLVLVIPLWWLTERNTPTVRRAFRALMRPRNLEGSRRG